MWRWSCWSSSPSKSAVTKEDADYDSYVAQHPNTTKDAAAQESGFTSYSAYYKAKERYEG